MPFIRSALIWKGVFTSGKPQASKCFYGWRKKKTLQHLKLSNLSRAMSDDLLLKNDLTSS